MTIFSFRAALRFPISAKNSIVIPFVVPEILEGCFHPQGAIQLFEKTEEASNR